MSTSTIPSTLALAVFKEFYDDNYVDLIYQKNPLWGQLPKRSAYGKYIDYPVKAGYTAGRSTDFPTAQNLATPEVTYNFNVPFVKKYSIENVQNCDIELSSETVGAFVNVLTDGLKGAMRGAGQDGETQAYGNGSGQIGVLGVCTNTSGSIWTMKIVSLSDMYKFYIGQVIVQAADASSALDSGSILITAVDVDNQQLTGTATTVTPTATKVVFTQGDYGIASSTGSRTALFGLDGFIPMIRTGLGTTFCNVPRANNPNLLAGNYVDGRNIALPIALNKGAMRMLPWDAADPDAIFMSTTQYGNLRDQLDTKARYVNVQGKGLDIYYRGIEIDVGNTTATVYPAAKAPDDRTWMITTATWKLQSPGNQPIKPTPLASSASGYIDLYNDDAVQIRQRMLAVMTNSAPVGSTVIQLM